MQGCDYYPTGLKGVGRFFIPINPVSPEFIGGFLTENIDEKLAKV